MLASLKVIQSDILYFMQQRSNRNVTEPPVKYSKSLVSNLTKHLNLFKFTGNTRVKEQFKWHPTETIGQNQDEGQSYRNKEAGFSNKSLALKKNQRKGVPL